MKTRVVIPMVLAALCVMNVPAMAKDRENVVGAVWRITLTKDKESVEHRVRVYEKVVYDRDRKIGTVRVKDEDETVMVITDQPSLNGRIVLRKVMNGAAGGTFFKADGTQWQARVQFINR